MCSVVYCTIDAKNTECPICLSDLDTVKFEDKVILGCEHEVCNKCWTELFFYTNRKVPRRLYCPFCKSDQTECAPAIVRATWDQQEEQRQGQVQQQEENTEGIDPLWLE